MEIHSWVTDGQCIRNLAPVPVPVDAALRLSYRFQCQSSRGAFLILWDDATKSVVQHQALDFQDYMHRHHASWHAFATQRLRISCSQEDIVLVRGTIKTSCWTVGAFIGCGARDHGVTLDGQLGPLVNVGFSYYGSENSQTSPVIPRSGPSSRVISNSESPKNLANTARVATDDRQNHSHPHDQCIFVNYYKMKRRSFLPRKLFAAADSSGIDGDGSSSTSSAAFIDLETEARQKTSIVSYISHAIRILLSYVCLLVARSVRHFVGLYP
jgi:hypothetical protein